MTDKPTLSVPPDDPSQTVPAGERCTRCGGRRVPHGDHCVACFIEILDGAKLQ